MKGKVYKNKDGEWEARFASNPDNMFETKALPLHPDDVKQLEKDSIMFDNIEGRIKNFDIELVEEGKYAKIVNENNINLDLDKLKALKHTFKKIL